jgi:hypothetical protein
MLLPLHSSAARGNFNTQPRERTMVSSKLFSTPNDDDDDDNVDEEESRLDSRSTVGRGMYTEGGVIMPEGGANPCVIKVRERTNYMMLLYIYIYSSIVIYVLAGVVVDAYIMIFHTLSHFLCL